MAATVEPPPLTDPSADPELPKAAVKRLVKAKMQQLVDSNSKDKKVLNVNKDADLAFQESGRVFINYLASTANDFAKESKRVTISPEDVFKALEELEFTEFVQPLRQYLEAHRSKSKEKSAAKKRESGGASTARKRKAAAVPAAAEEGGEEPAAQQEQQQQEGEAGAGEDQNMADADAT